MKIERNVSMPKAVPSMTRELTSKEKIRVAGGQRNICVGPGCPPPPRTTAPRR